MEISEIEIEWPDTVHREMRTITITSYYIISYHMLSVQIKLQAMLKAVVGAVV